MLGRDWVAEKSRNVPSFVTFVLPDESERARWSAGERAKGYTVVRDVDVLERTLNSPVLQAAGEIARVVIDGGTSMDRFLVLVSGLPATFAGEVLFISRDGAGYLSTRELQTMRTVKTLTSVEVEIYLRWHGLPAKPRGSYTAPERPSKVTPAQLSAPEKRR
jgi:hypothetical protein